MPIGAKIQIEKILMIHFYNMTYIYTHTSLSHNCKQQIKEPSVMNLWG